MIKKNLRPVTEIAFVILLALPLVLYAWIGFYSRYVADDFWSAGYLRTLGFWGAQHYWYTSWTGRYTNTFLVALAELLGPGTTSWLPVTSLVLWIVALYWLFDGLFKLIRVPYSRMVRLGAALLVLYTTLRTLVNWQQVILWLTGILTYTMPMIGLTFWSAWFLTRINQPETYKPKWSALLFTILVFWFLGGFSETSLVFQTTVLGLALVLFFLLPSDFPHKRGALLLLAMGLAGSLAALLSDLLAPGNSMKLVNNGGIQAPHLFEMLRQTFSSAEHYIKNSFDNSLRPMLCILGIPALLAFGFHPRLEHRPALRDLVRPAGFLALFALVILTVYWICFVPSYAVLRMGPPLRSLVVMFSWLSLTLGIESYAFGMTLNRLAQWISPFFQRADILRVTRAGAVLATFVLLVLGPLQSAQKLWRVMPEYQQFAAEWDARDRVARQAAADGAQDVVLFQLNDLYGMGPEIPGQFALYYGLPGTVIFESLHP
jgi:hypothetical protein